MIGCKPSNAVVVEALAGVSLTDAICAPAATFGGEGVGAVASSVAVCASGGVAGVGGASRRWQRPFSRSGLGIGYRWGDWRRGEPRTVSPEPHLSFIALCDGGPPTM